MPACRRRERKARDLDDCLSFVLYDGQWFPCLVFENHLAAIRLLSLIGVHVTKLDQARWTAHLWTYEEQAKQTWMTQPVVRIFGKRVICAMVEEHPMRDFYDNISAVCKEARATYDAESLAMFQRAMEIACDVVEHSNVMPIEGILQLELGKHERPLRPLPLLKPNNQPSAPPQEPAVPVVVDQQAAAATVSGDSCRGDSLTTPTDTTETTHLKRISPPSSYSKDSAKRRGTTTPRTPEAESPQFSIPADTNYDDVHEDSLENEESNDDGAEDNFSMVDSTDDDVYEDSLENAKRNDDGAEDNLAMVDATDDDDDHLHENTDEISHIETPMTEAPSQQQQDPWFQTTEPPAFLDIFGILSKHTSLTHSSGVFRYGRQHTFPDEHGLATFLVQRGIPEYERVPPGQERRDLERWVRFAHVKMNNNHEDIRSLKIPSDEQALEWLEVLGMKRGRDANRRNFFVMPSDGAICYSTQAVRLHVRQAATLESKSSSERHNTTSLPPEDLLRLRVWGATVRAPLPVWSDEGQRVSEMVPDESNNKGVTTLKESFSRDMTTPRAAAAARAVVTTTKKYFARKDVRSSFPSLPRRPIKRAVVTTIKKTRKRKRTVTSSRTRDERSSPSWPSARRRRRDSAPSCHDTDKKRLNRAWHVLKKHGWTYRSGSTGLENWWYIVPGHLYCPKTSKHGVDYFVNETEVLEYCQRQGISLEEAPVESSDEEEAIVNPIGGDRDSKAEDEYASSNIMESHDASNEEESEEDEVPFKSGGSDDEEESVGGNEFDSSVHPAVATHVAVRIGANTAVHTPYPFDIDYEDEKLSLEEKFDWNVLWKRLSEEDGWYKHQIVDTRRYLYVRRGKSVHGGQLGVDFFRYTREATAFVNQQEKKKNKAPPPPKLWFQDISCGFPSFPDLWQVLTRHTEFCFFGGKYHYGHTDHAFERERELQAFLVQRGIPELHKIPQEEHQDLDRWVRFAHVHVDGHNCKDLVSLCVPSDEEALGWLEVLGMTRDDGYVLPNGTVCETVQDVRVHVRQTADLVDPHFGRRSRQKRKRALQQLGQRKMLALRVWGATATVPLPVWNDDSMEE